MKTRSSLVTLRGTFDASSGAFADAQRAVSGKTSGSGTANDATVRVVNDGELSPSTAAEMAGLEVPSDRNEIADLLYGRCELD